MMDILEQHHSFKIEINRTSDGGYLINWSFPDGRYSESLFAWSNLDELMSDITHTIRVELEEADKR